MKKFETDFYSKYDVKSSSFICLRNSCSTGEANTIPFGPLFEHMQEMKESDMSKIKYFSCGPVADFKLPMQGAWVWFLVGELDPTCCNKEWRCHMPQLRSGAAKQILFFFFNEQI